MLGVTGVLGATFIIRDPCLIISFQSGKENKYASEMNVVRHVAEIHEQLTGTPYNIYSVPGSQDEAHCRKGTLTAG